MTTILFIGFLLLMTALVVALVQRYIGGRSARGAEAALFVWILYVGLLSYLGVVENVNLRPPGIAFVVVPVIVFVVIFVLRANRFELILATVPPWLLVAMQTFRIGVELLLHRLWIEGIVPRMLTFRGTNLDIYVAVSAGAVAWLCNRGRAGLKLAVAWNTVGLLVLSNVVVRAVLTTPGPLNLVHTEVPNRMFGTFPFTFIPAFFVPLAVVLHVLAIRTIGIRLRLPTVAPLP